MNRLGTMKSMEYDDEDSMDAAMPIPMSEKPRYPYNLRISLTDKELAKLQLDHTEAEVGGMVHGCFMARITSVSSNETDDGERRCVELQIENLGIASEDEENAEAMAEKPKKPRRVLYAD